MHAGVHMSSGDCKMQFAEVITYVQCSSYMGKGGYPDI